MGSYILSSSTSHPINMKFLVLTVFVTVSFAASYAGLQTYPNGAVTPVDEPAVAAARADHLAAKSGAGLGYTGYAPGYAAAGYGSGYARYGAGLGYVAGYTTGYSGLRYAGYAPTYAGAYGYAGPLNLNTQLIAHPNGAVVPLDEPAVAAARADHLATKGVAYAADPIVAAAPVADVGYSYNGPLNLNTELLDYPNGAVVPVDEPAVAAARADHLASKEAAYAAAAPIVAAALI